MKLFFNDEKMKFESSIKNIVRRDNKLIINLKSGNEVVFCEIDFSTVRIEDGEIEVIEEKSGKTIADIECIIAENKHQTDLLMAEIIELVEGGS